MYLVPPNVNIMNHRILSIPASILALCALTLSLISCGTRITISPVAGTMDGPVAADPAPSAVEEAIEHAAHFNQYEIMSAEGISVEAISEADATPTEGYGIIVVKEGVSTKFPNLRNSRSPKAKYDKEKETLWLTSSLMEGTGVQVDWLHQIVFDEDGMADIAWSINPYDVQVALLDRLGYSIDGQDITLWDDTNMIATVTNTVTNMGGFDDEDPVWVGEQITYDISGPTPLLLVTPGVKFTTGLVLTYDDMPTIAAPLIFGDEGTVNIGEFEEYR